jgi:tellurite resistance protein
VKVDLHREEAPLMLALLVAGADGQADSREARILAEFARGHAVQPEPSRRLADLLATLGLERTVHAVAASLPTPVERRDALRLALAVAFSDGRLAPAEADRVAHVADALRLDEDDLRALLAADRR